MRNSVHWFVEELVRQTEPATGTSGSAMVGEVAWIQESKRKEGKIV